MVSAMINREIKIIFYGNGSSGNHGCEAIVRGTEQLLGKANYTVLSENVSDDCLYGLDKIANLLSAKTETRLDFRFIKSYIKLKLTGNFTEMDGLNYLPTIQKLRGHADLALSVGGDNYCYGNTAIYGYLNSEYHKNGIKTSLWGCSIEPDIVMKPDVVADLRQYDIVTARDSITFEAVKTIGANVFFMPDPAFHMLPQRCNFDHLLWNKEVIGINISPHIIVSEIHQGVVYNNYKALIQYILLNTNANIALIPHVVWASNDDRIPLRQLYNDFDQNSRVIFVEDHSAPELKYIISKCSFFIGARTHATIAAYSTGVPTLVVGYSVKAQGIARDLFGNEADYVLPVQQLRDSDELTKAFCKLYEKRSEIRSHLNSVLPRYISCAENARKALEELVKQ